MKLRIILDLPPKVKKALWRHLIPRGAHPCEEVAFLFAYTERTGEAIVFKLAEWFPVGADGFLLQSGYHLELTDEVRARAIKRAHDLGASLIEAHSHIFHGVTRFSSSDRSGFEEFVPHVWWRLRGRPYMALVVSPSGFDALAWIEDPKKPEYVDGIVVDGAFFKASQTSLEESIYDGSL